MRKSLSAWRREYVLFGLRRKDLDPDAVAQFRKWFHQVADTAIVGGRLRKLLTALYKASGADVNAMTLATVDSNGHPSARAVLLKGIDERGFSFYTNYQSQKGTELADHPHATLVFYWPHLERQVRISGRVTRLPAEESDAYFRTRPRKSQIAAWASQQSQVVPDRETLEKQWTACEQKYHDEKEIPRPPYWGGYVVAPEQVEFWQGRPNRMHDRFRYLRQADQTWVIERLCP